MMNLFKLTKIKRLTAIYFISLLFLYRLAFFPNLFFIIAIISYIFILAFGSMNIRSNFYLDAVSSLPGNAAVMLTFNLAKTGMNTMALIRLLKETDIKVMFFVTGQLCEENPELIKNIYQQGHTIGNHFYNLSKHFGFYSSSKLIVSIEKTDSLIYYLTNEKVKYFRPPLGITNPFVNKAVKKLNLTVIGWKMKFNLEKLEKNRSYTRIIQKIKGGEIILIDLVDSINIDPVRTFIEEIKQRDMGFYLLD